MCQVSQGKAKCHSLGRSDQEEEIKKQIKETEEVDLAIRRSLAVLYCTAHKSMIDPFLLHPIPSIHPTKRRTRSG